MPRARRGRGEGSVFFDERRNEWVASLSLGADANGKRIRRTLYGASKKAVQQKLADLRARVGIELTAERNITLAAFAEDWFARDVTQNRRPTTARYYRLLLDGYILPQLGRKRLVEITVADVERAIAIARELRSAAMAAKVRTGISRIFNRARKLGIVNANPAAATDVPRVSRKEMAFLTPEQVRALLASAKGERLEALIVILATTGIRIGECLALEWRDLDLSRRTLHVTRTLQESTGVLRIAEPKTVAGRRTLALGKLTLDALRRRRSAAKAEGFDREADPIFPTTTGTWMRRKNVADRFWKPLLAKAGLPQIRLHDLRHSSAALSIATGQSARTVAERLGHSDPAFTLRTYGHAGAQLHRDEADAIDAILQDEKSDD